MFATRFVLLAAVLVFGPLATAVPALTADPTSGQAERDRSLDEPSFKSPPSQYERLDALEADLAQLREQVATQIDRAEEGDATARTVDQLRVVLVALGVGLAVALYEILRVKRQLSGQGGQQ